MPPQNQLHGACLSRRAPQFRWHLHDRKFRTVSDCSEPTHQAGTITAGFRAVRVNSTAQMTCCRSMSNTPGPEFSRREFVVATFRPSGTSKRRHFGRPPNGRQCLLPLDSKCNRDDPQTQSSLPPQGGVASMEPCFGRDSTKALGSPAEPAVAGAKFDNFGCMEPILGKRLVANLATL